MIRIPHRNSPELIKATQKEPCRGEGKIETWRPMGSGLLGQHVLVWLAGQPYGQRRWLQATFTKRECNNSHYTIHLPVILVFIQQLFKCTGFLSVLKMWFELYKFDLQTAFQEHIEQAMFGWLTQTPWQLLPVSLNLPLNWEFSCLATFAVVNR